MRAKDLLETRARCSRQQGEVFYIDLNVRQKITFDMDKLTEVHKEGNIEVLMAHKIGESESNVIKHGMFLVKQDGVVIDEFIVKTDESTPHLKRIDFLETDFSSFLSLDLNFESKFVDVTNKRPRKKIGDCGQDVIDCFQDVYTNHGWASVAAALTTAFIPQTAVVFAAGCVGKNC